MAHHRSSRASRVTQTLVPIAERWARCRGRGPRLRHPGDADWGDERRSQRRDHHPRAARWIEDQVGGTVVEIHRQPRWRPVWFVDVERDGERLELVVRGDRTDMPLIFPLDHEMRLQEVMHDHGIPTPKVYGMIDDPLAYVMDRVGGQQDFTDTSDDDRRAAVDDYLQILARLHTLPLEPFVDAGIMRAARPRSRARSGSRATRPSTGPRRTVRTRSWSSASAGCTATRPLTGPGVGHHLGLGAVPPGRRPHRGRARP